MAESMAAQIESLKVRFYSIIGRLELEKNIIISQQNLTIFERNVELCETEVEVAGTILGAIRRYEVLLMQGRGWNSIYSHQTLPNDQYFTLKSHVIVWFWATLNLKMFWEVHRDLELLV